MAQLSDRSDCISEDEAWAILYKLHATKRLLQHAGFVLDVAKELVKTIQGMQISVSSDFVCAGAILHDVGKTKNPDELHAPGKQHEADGPIILENLGISKKLANVAKSHAQWRDMDCSIEELIVALSDKLWKGARDTELEMCVIHRLAERLGRETWDIFNELDSIFERLANDGPKRLECARTT